MACLTPLSLNRAQAIGAGFGLEVATVKALSLGSVNSNFELVAKDGQRYFARIYEEQGVDGARAELKLLRELDAVRVPVALPRRFADGGDLAEVDGKPFSIYEWREGIHLCNALVSPERTHQLGEVLARVHTATPTLSAVPTGRFGVDGIVKRLSDIESQSEVFQKDARAIRAKLEHYGVRRSENLPSGLIHGDLFRDNVLWQGEELAALLDFESASFGSFAYDIAVCILSWCYTDGLRIDCARALLDGYQGVRPLEPVEISELKVEAALVCVRFATTRIQDFSMRAGPGETPARDYRRFLKRLADVEAGALDALF